MSGGQNDESSPGGRQRREEQKAWRQLAEYSSLAVALPIAAVLGYLVGKYLDDRLETGFFAVLGLLLGIAAGFVQLVTKALRDAKSSDR